MWRSVRHAAAVAVRQKHKAQCSTMHGRPQEARMVREKSCMAEKPHA